MRLARLDTAEARAFYMLLHDSGEDGQEIRDQLTVTGMSQIGFGGVKEPQRRVGGVVQPLAALLGEQVRDQALVHVLREHVQDEARFVEAPGRVRRVCLVEPEPIVVGARASQAHEKVTRREPNFGIEASRGQQAREHRFA